MKVMGWAGDFRYALRLLLKNPGFSVLTSGVMAVGLGISLYMLAFLDVNVLRPLPFDRGEDMYVIETEVNGLRVGSSVNQHDAELLLETLESFESLGMMNATTVNVSNGNRAIRVNALFSTANLFSFLSITPAQGRAFTGDETRPGSLPVAIIGYDLWQSQFAGQPDVIGRTIKVSGQETEIVGIMEKGFYFPSSEQIWLPLTRRAADSERELAYNVSVFGLKKPGVSIEEANLELEALFSRLEQEYPRTNAGTTASAWTFPLDMMGEGAGVILGAMSTAVIMVLILSCINVGNLLLARANERAKETAVRVALGAPRRRLVMQMMWESIIICAIGGTLGILLAGQGWELTKNFFPRMMPIAPPFYWMQSFDLALVGRAVVIILFTAIVTGLVPAIRLSYGDFNALLRDGTRGAVGRKAMRMTRTLVIVEVALSATLMTAAGILVVLLEQLQAKDYGTRRENILTSRIGLPPGDYPDSADRASYFQRLLDDAARLPGVKQAGLISSPPGRWAGRNPVQPFDVAIDGDQFPVVGRVAYTPGTLDLYEVPLLAGRQLNEFDMDGAPRVGVIDEKAASRLWPDEDPIGKRLQWVDSDDDAWITIVGVVGHVTHGQPYALVPQTGTLYQPYDQVRRANMSVVLDVVGNPDRYRETLVDLAARLDHEVPVYRIQSQQELLDRGIGGMKLIRNLFMVFAVAALVLAASGIYGVLSNTTGRRTHEIGIRRALGAPDGGVLMLLMRQGWKQLLIGLLMGMPLGYLMSNQFVRMIGAQDNSHWWVVFWIPLTIAAIVTVATWVPARRAIKLEPHAALHCE